MTAVPPLSGAQLTALDWLLQQGPSEPRAYRAAGIASTTVHSLRRRGFADWDFDRIHGRPVYFATRAGAEIVASDRQRSAISRPSALPIPSGAL